MSTSLTDSFGLVAILDAATHRDLLLDPQPLCVPVDAEAKTVTLRIQNGPNGPLRLTVSADQPWLRLDQTNLDVAAGATADLPLTVHPDGAGEFAVLQLAWRDRTEDFAEHILVQRQRMAPKPPATPQPVAPPAASASTGTTALPDWMR